MAGAAELPGEDVEEQPAPQAPSVRRASRLARVFTILGANASGVWTDLLQHFQLSLQGASAGALQANVLRYDETAPELLAEVRADVPRESFRESAGFAAADVLARSMSEERWTAWHVAKFFKTVSFARIAADPAHEGLLVLCADVDHTFFPGFLPVVERCLESHDLCFESNFISAGTPAEAGELVHEVPLGRPAASYWSYAYVNTGMFAMRCNSATAAFWDLVVRMMRWSFDDKGAASEQDAAIVILRDFRSDLNWGVFDPYAVNHLSTQALHGSRPPGPHLRKLLDSTVAHHAVYIAPECATGQVEHCKFKLMQLMNSTWFARRGAASAEGLPAPVGRSSLAELLLR